MPAIAPPERDPGFELLVEPPVEEVPPSAVPDDSATVPVDPGAAPFNVVERALNNAWLAPQA